MNVVKVISSYFTSFSQSFEKYLDDFFNKTESSNKTYQ